MGEDKLMIIWPEILPKPNISGFNYEPQVSTIRTEMEIGSKVRRRFSKYPTFISASWTFNSEQKTVFDAWFFHSLQSGTNWFQIYLPISENQIYKARFIGGYIATPYSNIYWNIHAKLEVEQLNIISEDELYLLKTQINVEQISLTIKNILEEIIEQSKSQEIK